jgi:DNA-binding XRE family transcriptional regulator
MLDKYPKGTYKGQKSDGKYIDGYLYDNLKILAKRIVDDMTFMGVIFSSTLEVGTGKSVLATQIGEAWSEIMHDMHGIDLPFDINNVVWKPTNFIERAFELPKYSFILLDEWEDQTYWSELGKTLRQFFRKCRQLNLFMIVIIPNWFQLNMSYAIGRSAFAIDVKFEKDFQRGYFSFYSFAAKRELYIKGKKEHNYKVVRPTFNGMFVDGYGVNEQEYRTRKLKDMMEYDQDNEKIPVEIKVKMFFYKRLKNKIKFNQKEWSELLELSRVTLNHWEKEDYSRDSWSVKVNELTYNTSPSNKVITWDEERIEREQSQEEDVTKDEG